MPQQPIGVTFIPSDDNAAEGPKRGSLEGAGNTNSDLASAFKILSLRLPRVLGARSLASRRLLTSPGSAGIPGAFNPHAAVFEALLNAMGGGGNQDFVRSLSSLYGGATGGAGGNDPFAPPDYSTRVTPGDEGHRDEPFSGDVPSSSWTPPTSGRLEDVYAGDLLGGRRRN